MRRALQQKQTTTIISLEHHVHATVHEIVAQWCSGHDELGPPGISDENKKHFAQPLMATRTVIDLWMKLRRP